MGLFPIPTGSFDVDTDGTVNVAALAMDPYAVREQLFWRAGSGTGSTVPGYISAIGLMQSITGTNLVASFDVPSDWDTSTDITVTATGYFAGNVTSGHKADFTLQYAPVATGEVFNPITGATQAVTATVATLTGPQTQYQQKELSFTLSRTNIAVGDTVFLKLTRSAPTGTETTETFVVTNVYATRYATKPIVG